MKEKTEKAVSRRYLSLDVFRGITIAGMILVNNRGGKTAYAPLNHAAWNGWTPTDLVFPFFVFIMGVAIAFSFANRGVAGQGRGRIYRHIVIRAAVLFALGLLASYDPAKGLAQLRIMGVLQRLALCYLFASLIAMNAGTRGLAAWAAGLAALYWLLMKTVPVPGFGAGDLTREGNLAAYIDNLLLKGHLYTPNWDPEGLLHTLTAISTCLIGALAGHYIRSEKSITEKVSGLFAAGVALVPLAYILNYWFPINKNLWSPSYVALTGGLAICLLALCLWLIEFKGRTGWTPPFAALGVNPLFAYLISGLLMNMLTWPSFAQPGGGRIELKDWITQHVYLSWAGPYNGSLLFALSYVALWMGITALMRRKKIIIKI